MKKLTLLIAIICSGFFASAQINVNGKVTDAKNGDPIPGVSISVKNFTEVAVLTDSEGNYTITVPEGGTTLIFNYFGMKTKTVEINNRTVLDVELESSDITIDDVVVTALGIKREKKALGYSVQDVSGEDISKSNPDNVVSALSGNIAGAQIITSSGQVGASSTISIRGNKTFTGSTQPLFVVDGTPIMNGISSARS
ncbi:MAG: carboxypeptidase-like regulatory domain-containing protein, partial [Bacteroidales bacterium]|nr:carboxypeptidase-like regulatory domain-containing protein [Bacteroidales bacterium]